MLFHRSVLSLVVFLAVGCSAIVSPDDGRLGGATLPDSGADTGVVPQRDSGGVGDAEPPPPDDGAVPPPCTARDPQCVGNVQVTCVDGVEERVDCAAAGEFCDSARGSCEDQVCVPDVARCDGDRLFVCDHVGGSEERTDCPLGCSSGACNAEPVPCAGVPRLDFGMRVRVDTCGAGDDETYEETPAGGGCASDLRANGPDVLYAFVLTERRAVEINLRDADSSVAIDTVVYLRTSCDDPSSQLACSDDLPCAETSFGCTSGGRLEVRESRVTTTLDPGTYYIVVDSFNYSTSTRSFSCGEVLLSLGAASIVATP